MNKWTTQLLLGALLSTSGLLCFAKTLPSMPEPVTNNAVTLVDTDQGQYLLSFMGLGPGKDYQAVHNKVWALKLGQSSWQSKKPVPSSLTLKGRLASIAVSVGQYAYIFGGYTVDKDHSEISSPDNFRFDVTKNQYMKIAKTPVPVDDSVALVYQDRYIYLISGWHNDGNVNLVQIYDSNTDSWSQGSPFPGHAVFGQAGGIVGNFMLICDGVRVKPRETQRRTFAAETACYSGTIDQKNFTKVDWRVITHPTGKARYRMAATGLTDLHEIVFLGGSGNPYNYNGIGYDGRPSEPDNKLWRFNMSQGTWLVQKSDVASMDHRGLILIGDSLLVPGGMGRNQKVLNTITQISIVPLSTAEESR